MRDYLTKTAEEAFVLTKTALSTEDRMYADDSYRNRLNYLYKPLAFGLGGAALGGLALARDTSLIGPRPALRQPALVTMGITGGLGALGGLAHSLATHKSEAEKAKTYYKDTPVEHVVDGTAMTYKEKIKPFLEEMENENYTRLYEQLTDPYATHRSIAHTANAESHGSPDAAKAIAGSLVDNYASASDYMNMYKLDPYDIAMGEVLDHYAHKTPADRYVEYLALKNDPKRYRRYEDIAYTEHQAELAEKDRQAHRQAYYNSLYKR